MNRYLDEAGLFLNRGITFVSLALSRPIRERTNSARGKERGFQC